MKNYIAIAALLAAGTACMHADSVTYWWQKGSNSDMSDVNNWKADTGETPTSINDKDATFSVGGNGGSVDISDEVHFSTLRLSAWSNMSFTYTSVNGTISADSIIRDTVMQSGSFKIYIDYNVRVALDNTAGELVLFSSTKAFDDGMNDLTRFWDTTTSPTGKDFVSVYVKNQNGTLNESLVLVGTSSSENGIFSSVEDARAAIDAGTRPYALVLTENKLLLVSSVPEPSAFGLLAGIGALALVASRRRRK